MKKLSPKQKRWLLRLLVIFGSWLIIPAVQVMFVVFIHPPTTVPMSVRWLKGRFNQVYQGNLYLWVNVTNVAESYLAAVFITEDRHFFEHGGFDW